MYTYFILYWITPCESTWSIMYPFTAIIDSGGYHVYRNSIKLLFWRKSNILIDINPYCCCRITIKRIDRIRPVTVGHVPRELSRFCILSKKEAQLPALFQKWLLINHLFSKEKVLLLTHEKEAFSSRMEDFVTKQTKKMEEKMMNERKEAGNCSHRARRWE